jgi:hypothetical protein
MSMALCCNTLQSPAGIPAAPLKGAAAGGKAQPMALSAPIASHAATSFERLSHQSSSSAASRALGRRAAVQRVALSTRMYRWFRCWVSMRTGVVFQ